MIFPEILNILFYSAILDSAWMLITHKPYGMLGNRAADASFIACMLPMVFEKGLYKWKVYVSAILMVLAIGFTKSSTGLASIGVGVSAILFQTLRKRNWLFVSILGAILVALAGYFLLGSELMDPSGRQIIWKEAYDTVLSRHAYWFGFNTGSFTDLGVHIQRINHPDYVWTWLHNDYLEVFYENGLLGLGLFLVLCWYICRRLFLSKDIGFPIAIVYLFTAITEMPLRLFVTQVLGICLLSKAFSLEKSPSLASK